MAYFDALARMFEQAPRTTTSLSDNIQSGLLVSFEYVRNVCRQLGYSVADDMDVLFSESDSSFQAGVRQLVITDQLDPSCLVGRARRELQWRKASIDSTALGILRETHCRETQHKNKNV